MDARSHPTAALPWHSPTTMQEGALQTLKWLALLAMTADHLNKYLLDHRYPWLFDFGRLAMPLFAALLGWNLARPQALACGVYLRVAKRLALAGLIATPPYLALGGAIAAGWPLNAMATLLVATGILYGLDRATPVSRTAALVLFVVGGALGEFWWPALLVTIGVWRCRRGKSVPGAALALLGLAGLCWINGNLWALASLPLAAGVACLNPSLPRWRGLFYGYYPAHLAALYVIRSMNP